MDNRNGLKEQEKKWMLDEIEQKKQEKLKELEQEENNKKNNLLKIVTYVFLSLSLVLMVAYSIQTVLNSENIMTQLINIVSTFILAIFTIFFVFTNLFANSKKSRIFVIIASILLSIYSSLNLLVGADIIHFGKEEVVLDFTKKDISEVMSWANDNDITINQVYENSETIEQYKVIKQDVEPGTKLKKVEKITITISDGPNPNKEMSIPNMIGWNIDKVIEYVDENRLLNVSIDFEFHNEVKRDVVFSQNIESTIKRTEPLKVKASLGKENEFKYATMIDLVGMDEFHATTWLKRNRISYEFLYGYSEEFEQGTVIKQKDKKGKVFDVTKNPVTTLTLARNQKISIPNFNEMTIKEINSWASENKIKLNLIEQYDDTIKKGKLIESSRKYGDTIEVGDSIKVILSKGPIYMPKFTTVDNFRKWADENEISYTIDYEFSAEFKAGELISYSHQENQLIKNTDTIKLTISEGSTTKVPDFSDMSKAEIDRKCKSANLICEYKYEASNTIKKDIIIRQSMRPNSTVPENTTVTITLSSGK